MMSHHLATFGDLWSNVCGDIKYFTMSRDLTTKSFDLGIR